MLCSLLEKYNLTHSVGLIKLYNGWKKSKSLLNNFLFGTQELNYKKIWSVNAKNTKKSLWNLKEQKESHILDILFFTALLQSLPLGFHYRSTWVIITIFFYHFVKKNANFTALLWYSHKWNIRARSFDTVWLTPMWILSQHWEDLIY